MRILVVSDTHGDEGALQRAVQAQPFARTVIHLGDGAREAEAVAARFPDRMFCTGQRRFRSGFRRPALCPGGNPGR